MHQHYPWCLEASKRASEVMFHWHKPLRKEFPSTLALKPRKLTNPMTNVTPERQELYKVEVWKVDSYNRLQIPVLKGLLYSDLKLVVRLN